MATFSIHYDGPITVDHKLPIRTLAKTYEAMQRAIDRAYLIDRYGDVWKHARLTSEQYDETVFIAEYPREGGIYLDAVKEQGNRIVDRIAEALRPIFQDAFQGAVQEHANLTEQLVDRQNQAISLADNNPTFEALMNNAPHDWARRYSNRSIVKEIDQLSQLITPDRLYGSILEINLNGTSNNDPFVFDSTIAKRFHKIAASRYLSYPIRVTATIRSLDRGNKSTKPSAKIVNIATGREITLKLSSLNDCDELRHYHNGSQINIYASPIVECHGFDVKGGDMMYLGLAN